jgi:hypothetical protein
MAAMMTEAAAGFSRLPALIGNGLELTRNCADNEQGAAQSVPCFVDMRTRP